MCDLDRQTHTHTIYAHIANRSEEKKYLFDLDTRNSILDEAKWLVFFTFSRTYGSSKFQVY